MRSPAARPLLGVRGVCVIAHGRSNAKRREERHSRGRRGWREPASTKKIEEELSMAGVTALTAAAAKVNSDKDQRWAK